MYMYLAVCLFGERDADWGERVHVCKTSGVGGEEEWCVYMYAKGDTGVSIVCIVGMVGMCVWMDGWMMYGYMVGM